MPPLRVRLLKNKPRFLRKPGASFFSPRHFSHRQLIQWIKQSFFQRTLREKALISLFLIVCLSVWLLATFKRAGILFAEFKNTSYILKENKRTLNNASLIETELDNLLENFDSSKTFDRNKLAGRIDALAREIDLDYELLTPKMPESEAIFDLHTIKLRVDRVEITDVITLDEALKKEAPYILLQSIFIKPNKNYPHLLDVDLNINSFELKDEEK